MLKHKEVQSFGGKDWPFINTEISLLRKDKTKRAGSNAYLDPAPYTRDFSLVSPDAQG